ncbi:MAG: hypothetical protein A2252_02150 [Elusimicrobia bacterium RIFOXYA2_FULL_39_19]|nr:MAG: hypothetical protein A2252_02150 [Elusimicrobia bacterium RIFOXYA2_FULL_39_19]
MDFYHQIANKYKKLPLKYERKLIRSAKKGNSASKEILLLHLTGFFVFRFYTSTYLPLIRNSFDDIIQDCLVLALKNIKTYKMRYKNEEGIFQPVHFSTYMWKGVTGIMVSAIKAKREICFSDLPEYFDSRNN